MAPQNVRSERCATRVAHHHDLPRMPPAPELADGRRNRIRVARIVVITGGEASHAVRGVARGVGIARPQQPNSDDIRVSFGDHGCEPVVVVRLAARRVAVKNHYQRGCITQLPSSESPRMDSILTALNDAAAACESGFCAHAMPPTSDCWRRSSVRRRQPSVAGSR